MAVSLLVNAPIPPAVLEVLDGLNTTGHRAFLVGGCVRDALRGQTPKDFDVATSALPAQVQQVFKKVIPTGVEHGTVTVVLKGQHVEVTTFRLEADYLDGRRPSKVEFHTDIEADLSRRDFTINAMAYDPLRHELIDPFGGQADLASRLIRCVRSPLERFSEDGLRAMRAVRFGTVLEFSLDPATEAAIAPTAPIFRKVATERINQEFVKLLLAPKAPWGLEVLRRTTLLDVFLPEALKADFEAVGRAAPSLELRLAVLLAGAADVYATLVRLKCSNQQAATVDHLVKHRPLPDPQATDGTLRRWLAKVEPGYAGSILALNEALGTPAIDQRIAAVLASDPPLTLKALALTGQGIMQALGVGPSQVVGEAMRHLFEVVLDDPSRNTAEALTAEVRAWFKTSPRARPE